MNKTFEITVELPEGVADSEIESAIDSVLDDMACTLLDFSEA